MDGKNLLIFTVYLIVVVYVFYKAYSSLENQVTIELDAESLKQQLSLYNLNGLIDISFKKMFAKYEFDDLKTVVVTIKNKFEEDTKKTIRINLDESSIIDF